MMNVDYQIISKWVYFILFLSCFAVLCYVYNYVSIYHSPPYSVHSWRQTDGTSIALNYYQDGLSFFKPRMHNVLTDNGQSVGEFPALYYLTALIYSLGGVNEGYFRLLSLFIFFAGIYSFSLLLKSYSRSWIIGLTGGLFLSTSPVNAFYSFNFLPDAPALGLVLTGWYFFFQYFQKRFRKDLLIGLLLFLLAGLLKITMLTSFVALMLLYPISKTGLLKMKNRPFFPDLGTYFFAIIAIVLPVVSWYLWAHHYNQVHSSYLLMGIKPIWDLDFQHIKDIYDRVTGKWYLSYFHISSFSLLLGLFVFIIWCRKYLSAGLYYFFWLVTVGVGANILLWYGQLFHHDYYAITWMILPAGILFCTANITGNLESPMLKAVIASVWLLLLPLNVWHCKNIMSYRYDRNSPYNISVNHAYLHTKPLHEYIRKLGIKPTDKVISLPDTSPNTSLYLMNLRGHTMFDYTAPYSKERIDSLVNIGFSYLIIGDSSLLMNPDLQPALKHPIGVFEEQIWFFRVGRD